MLCSFIGFLDVNYRCWLDGVYIMLLIVIEFSSKPLKIAG